MTSDTDILRKVQQAFLGCRRPEHFTDHTHCEECAEYDELLRSRDIHSLRMEDVGIPAWDPICFATSEGFNYYFPALARLSLDEPDAVHGWYGTVLLFHLIGDGRRNRRFLACTHEQQRAVVHLLQHLVETRAAIANEHGSTDDLLQAHEIWSDDSHEPLSAD